ncbi:MAG: polyprenyl synthetase family protein [Elusimicrobia bacterium]|nr:polyprenyl synthetase family protein [Elusimicrobiota bacterium]
METQLRKKLIERALKNHVIRFFGPGLLREAALYALFSGGKRIRPLLAFTVGEGLGADRKKLVAFGCALELIHNYTLIHDDLPAMDNDDYRRGKLTVHKKFGEACAILLGDAFLTHAFELLAELQSPKLSCLVARAIGGRGVILGQVLDLGLGQNGKDAKSLDFINQLKTAKLFEAAIVGAGFVAAKSPSPSLVKSLRAFAILFGRCFQLADDLADWRDESKKKVITTAVAMGEQETTRSLRTLLKQLERQINRLAIKPNTRQQISSLAHTLYAQKAQAAA